MPNPDSVTLRPERIEELSRQIGTALALDLAAPRAINRNTRLLSLDARIEAARAGHAGAAFAVVAGEVMELARHMDSSFHTLERSTAPLLGELEVLGERLARDVRGRRLADLAAIHLDLVGRNLYERSCDVRWWATEGALVQALENGFSADLEHASRRMGTILDSYTVYFDLVLCDLSGKVVANERPGQYRSAGMEVGQQEWYRGAMATANGAEFGFEAVHSSTLAGGEQALVYSTAVRRGSLERGEILGVAGVVFRRTALGQTIVGEAAIPPEEAPDTRVALLDAQGRVLARSKGSAPLGKLPLEAWLARDPAPRFSLVVDWEGSRHLVALARSQGYETHSTGWVSAIVQKLAR